MTDLERRALLGDREAQEECTRQGIVLTCPFCGSTVRLVSWRGVVKVICENCSASLDVFYSRETAIRIWNTRAAPPIGRCGTCRWAGENINYPSDPHIFCDQFERILLRDDFCSLYEEADHGQE